MARSSRKDTCVLVIDDDTGVRSLLKDLLERAGYSVTEAASGSEAIARLEHSSPDLVISDVHMGGGSGYEVCRALRGELGRDVPLILLSGTRTEPYDRVAGFELGADDYILKPFEPEELLARVRALLRRAGARAPDAAATEKPRAPYALTPRELEVLQLLAEGRSQVEIAKSLYLTPSTIAKHIERILKKLDARSRAEAVARAHQESLFTRQ